MVNELVYEILTDINVLLFKQQHVWCTYVVNEVNQ